MVESEPLLNVQDAEHRLIVTFASGDLPPEQAIPQLQEEIDALISEKGSRVLAVDLNGIPVLGSALLAFFVSLRLRKQADLCIEFLRPSAEIMEYLHVTRLDSIVHVRMD